MGQSATRLVQITLGTARNITSATGTAATIDVGQRIAYSILNLLRRYKNRSQP
jgi:hypothetical protein